MVIACDSNDEEIKYLITSKRLDKMLMEYNCASNLSTAGKGPPYHPYYLVLHTVVATYQ